MKGLNIVSHALHRMAVRIMDGAARRRAILELVRMQDRHLADLGIERGRIPEIVDGMIARRSATSEAPKAPVLSDTAAGTSPAGRLSEVPA